MFSTVKSPRAVEKPSARSSKPKFLQRITDKLNSQSAPDKSAVERREAALRERGLLPGRPPSRSASWPVSSASSSSAHHASPPSAEPPSFHDSSAAKRRREDALRERGLLPPLPSAPASSSSDAQPAPSAKHRRDSVLRAQGLLPPLINQHLEDQHTTHGGEWDATALVDEIRIENSLTRTRQTAAERIKADWEARRSYTVPELPNPTHPQFSWDSNTRPSGSRRLSGGQSLDTTGTGTWPRLSLPRQRTMSDPVTPSDEFNSFLFPVSSSPSQTSPESESEPTIEPEHRLSPQDLPPLHMDDGSSQADSSFTLTRSLSTCSALSGDTLQPRQPLDLRVHSPGAMAREASRIPDQESQRITMMAFMD